MTERLRIDKYLWAIRVFKTRALAAAACDQGKVKLDGVSVKASRAVSLQDRYEIRAPERKWLIEVTGLLSHRVQYSEAIQYYTDQTPPEDLAAQKKITSSFYTGKRQSKTGRPTKKQRRNLDDFIGG